MGIGTTSPSESLETTGNIFINAASGNPSFTIKTGGVGNNPAINYRAGDNVVFDNMLVASAATDYWRVGYGASGTITDEHLVVTSAGNVGIGTSSVTNSRVQVKGANNTTTAYADGFKATSNNETVEVQYSWAGINANDTLRLATGGTEAARIDSSGNLLVGKSVTTFNTAGFLYETGAAVEVTRSGNRVMRLNRTTNDGSILEFNKDGTTVGSIGSRGSPADLTIGTADTGLQFADGSNAIVPLNTTTNALRDAAIDLGVSGVSFKDLYLSGGVVFGSTGGAVTSKTLDDYEEGTYTPVLEFGGTASGISWSTREGKYTKVGNLVTVMVYMYTPTGRGAQTGIATLTLPFASDSAQPDHWVPLSNRNGIGAGTGKTLTAYISTNTPYFIFYAGDDAGGSNTSLSHAAFSASGLLEIALIFQYRTA